MPGTIPEPRGGKVWLVVAVLALLTLALAVWDLAIERDGGENWLLQVLFPLLLLVFAVTMYGRRKKGVR